MATIIVHGVARKDVGTLLALRRRLVAVARSARAFTCLTLAPSDLYIFFPEDGLDRTPVPADTRVLVEVREFPIHPEPVEGAEDLLAEVIGKAVHQFHSYGAVRCQVYGRFAQSRVAVWNSPKRALKQSTSRKSRVVQRIPVDCSANDLARNAGRIT